MLKFAHARKILFETPSWSKWNAVAWRQVSGTLKVTWVIAPAFFDRSCSLALRGRENERIVSSFTLVSPRLATTPYPGTNSVHSTMTVKHNFVTTGVQETNL